MTGNMTGNQSQVEWAQRLKLKVSTEFERVVRVFEGVAAKQQEPERAETGTIIAIVKELRDAVLANEDAGYYIRGWQEIKDQVRQMVSQDPRYVAIRASRELRKSKGA
jgi:hypothetical protein